MERKVKDFSRSEINKIAVHYATTSCDFSALYYTRLYNISESTFYSLIGKAIKEHIVSEQIAKMIALKSARNSERHGGDGGKERSKARYRRLMEQREVFEFSRDNREYYTIEYANSDYAVDMKAFAGIHYMSRVLLQRTLVSAVVDNIVSDEIVEKLRQKALQHNPAWHVERLFRELKRKRQKSIDEKKERQKQRRLQRKMRNEDDDVQSLFEALMLNPDDEETRKRLNLTDGESDECDDYSGWEPEPIDEEALEQLRFIQDSQEDYGIPDERNEQMESLEAAYGNLCTGDRVTKEDGNGNTEINPEQLSFLD